MSHVSKRIIASERGLERHETFCGLDLVLDMDPRSPDIACLGPTWGWRATCDACAVVSRPTWLPAMERLYAMALRAAPINIVGPQLGGKFDGINRHVIDQWKEMLGLCNEVDLRKMCTEPKGHDGDHMDSLTIYKNRWVKK